MGKANLDEERFEHPSYGVVNIGRVSIGGGGMRLFDSPFAHRHAVSIEISPAYLIRKLHGDSVFQTGRVPFIRAHMSEIQFAQMVLNTNYASGTPCTIETINGDRIPDPPATNFKKLWAKEVKKDFKDVADAVSKVESDVSALLAKDRVTKGELREIQDALRGMAQDIRENLPWMQERFQEAMDKTVATARGEIAAHLQNTIQAAGLAHLKSQAPAIELDPEKTPE